MGESEIHKNYRPCYATIGVVEGIASPREFDRQERVLCTRFKGHNGNHRGFGFANKVFEAP